MEVIERYTRARVPLIQLVTHEESRALGFLREVNKRMGESEPTASTRPEMYVWSIGRGLMKMEPNGKTNAFKDADPAEVLAMIAEHQKPAMFVLLDYHPYLCKENPSIVRAVRDLYGSLKSVKKTVVFLQPVRSIPVEMEKEMALVEMPLPDVLELNARVVGFVKSLANTKYDVALNEEAIEQIVQAGQGLTRGEFDTALALAVTEFGRLDPAAVLMVAEEKKSIIRKTGVLEYFEPDCKMDDVGGLEVLKAWTGKRKRAFTNEAREFGLPQPKGLLMVGIQGCGKSLTAKAVSSQWGLPLLRLDMGAMFGSLVGESESNIRSAIRMAEAVAPCVLWIDEIEKAMAGVNSSGSSDAGTAARVFGTMLTWMNEKKAPVFVMATANRVADLPPELMRKGRFDEIFFEDLPSAAERMEILKIHLTRRGRSAGTFDLGKLAGATHGFSGAELEQVVVAALYDAFDESRDLTTADMLKAALTTVPMSKTMSESVTALRDWCAGRAVPASLTLADKEEAILTGMAADLPGIDE